MKKEISNEVNENVSKSLMKEQKKKLKEKLDSIDKEEIKNKTIEAANEAKKYYKNNTKKVLLIAIIVVFAIAILGKIFSAIKASITETKKGLAVTEEVIELRELSNDVVYPCKVEAENSVPIVLKATAKVRTIDVKLGDYVEKGQLLFTLDKSDIEATVSAASASLMAAQANYNSINGGSQDASLIQAKSNRDNLEKQYLAAKEMKELGGISDVDFNSIEAGFKAADASYRALANSGLSAQRDSALAQLNQARASYNQAKQMLDDCTCVAPISGVVSTLNLKIDNYANAGTAPITIVNSDKLEINLNVSESLVSLIKKGDKVSIELNAFNGEKIEGIIDGVSDAAGQTSTYPVVIKFNNEDERIKSGMFGKVSFFTNRRDEAIVISVDNMIENGDEKYVFVEENNKAIKKIIETGINTGKEVEVLSGLSVGDKLITKGQDYLEDGDTVRVVEG